MVKTNVMRLLDAAGIEYEVKEYEVDEQDLSGSHAASMIGADHDMIYKTLVLKGEKTGYLVCCIPVDEELDLKKVARVVKESRNDPYEGIIAIDRIYTRRLFSDWNEKSVSYLYRRNSSFIRSNCCERRTERGTNFYRARRFSFLYKSGTCFSDLVDIKSGRRKTTCFFYV